MPLWIGQASVPGREAEFRILLGYPLPNPGNTVDGK